MAEIEPIEIINNPEIIEDKPIEFLTKKNNFNIHKIRC